MADLATLQTWLLEAELAQHKLLTGSAEEEIEHADMRVKYTRSVTALQALAGYIENLKSQIFDAGGTVSGSRRQAISIDLPG